MSFERVIGMTETYDWETITKWFLAKESMTPKKLQKLSYYFEAWGLALLHESLINNTKFEAWPHGPASHEIYTHYKKYGWTPIPKEDSAPEINDEVVANLLESVWLTYGDKSANELEALTHAEKPWQEAREGLGEYDHSDKEISKTVMRDFYNSIYSGD